MTDDFKQKVLLKCLSVISTSDAFILYGSASLCFFHIEPYRRVHDIDLVHCGGRHSEELEPLEKDVSCLVQKLKEAFAYHKVTVQNSSNLNEPILISLHIEGRIYHIQIIKSFRGCVFPPSKLELNPGLITSHHHKTLKIQSASIYDILATILLGCFDSGDYKHIYDMYYVTQIYTQITIEQDKLKQAFCFYLLCNSKSPLELLNKEILDQEWVSGFLSNTIEHHKDTSYEQMKAFVMDYLTSKDNFLGQREKRFIQKFYQAHFAISDIKKYQLPALESKYKLVQSMSDKSRRQYLALLENALKI